MTVTSNIDRVPGLRELQAASPAAERISIAVIDGPVETDHPTFANARLAQLGYGVRAAQAQDSSRTHGTRVASILFGRPGGPVAGVAPDCRGLTIPVFTDSPEGGVLPCSELDLARAIAFAREHGANVVNISAGRLSSTGVAGAHLHDAVRQCVDSGLLIIAAAGNDGCDCLQVPAALPGVLVVGAMDEGGEPVGFSNWGAAYRSRGVLAPGTNIISANPAGDMTRVSGTSFATPLVAGTAALLMAKQVEQGREPDAGLVMSAIVEGADRCDPSARDHCERFLAGTLNVDGALRYLESKTRSASPASVAGVRIIQSDNQTGSQTMDHDHGEATRRPESDAMPASLGAVAASLKSIEATMGELSRVLGEARPSESIVGSAAGVQVAQAAEPAVQPGLEQRTQPEVTAPSLPARQPTQSNAPAIDGEIIQPAACCEACAVGESRQLVYALGKVGYDLGNESRMDSIQSQLENRIQTEGRKPSVLNPADLVEFLKLSPAHAPAITWTLNLNETPIYAIRPEGDFVQEIYAELVRTLESQTTTAVAGEDDPKAAPIERMSLPGVVSGQVELMNGLVVPTVKPALGAMYTWSTEALIEALGKIPVKERGPNDEDKQGAFDPSDGLRTFLNRIYEELRNVGVAPQDRAMNFAATNAYQANDIFVKLRGRNIHIESFEVVRSPVMRPDSDCWDVKMTFYNPAELTTKPREVYFYTIDVSDVVPVAVGKPRHWTTY